MPERTIKKGNLINIPIFMYGELKPTENTPLFLYISLKDIVLTNKQEDGAIPAQTLRKGLSRYLLLPDSFCEKLDLKQKDIMLVEQRRWNRVHYMKLDYDRMLEDWQHEQEEREQFIKTQKQNKK